MADTGKDEVWSDGIEVKASFPGADDDLDFVISPPMLQKTVNQVKQTVLGMPQVPQIGIPPADVAMVLSFSNGEKKVMADSEPMSIYKQDFQTCDKLIFMNRNQAQNESAQMSDVDRFIKRNS